MKEELTKKMHEEFKLRKEQEIRHIAGSIWQTIGFNATDEEIDEFLKYSSISKKQLIKYKSYWEELEASK